MDILEVKEKQKALNAELSEFVWDKLKTFSKETGVSVKDITLNFVNVSDLNDTLPRYIAGSVQTELAL